jgi:signal transduction histidine kinase/CheY-like chemotaxis protein
VTANNGNEERILILSPWGRDGEVIRTVLSRDGFLCETLQRIDDLPAKILEGSGAAVISEEALKNVNLRGLAACLAQQESWSDFPFIILVSKQTSGVENQTRTAVSVLGNVILLERPLNAQTLESAVTSAMRGRRRQYQARAVLAGRTRTAESLRESQAELIRLNETLETHIADRTRALAQANDRLTNEMFERERVQQALVQFQKMEAVGRLTGGIAHDFNNLLNVVQGSMDLILLLSQDPEARRRAEVARRACERGAKLTGQLLAFSRNQNLHLRAVSASALFDGVRELVAASLGSRISLRFNVDDSCWVFADSNQMEMALLNLAINARDAMPGGGEISFSAAIAVPPDGLLPEGQYVRFSITDSGSGMSPEIAARVFEPFFTTKEVGQGTGLGLSQVYGMARQSGGGARLLSEIGKGTTVEIWLRCAAQGGAISGEAKVAGRAAEYGGAKVLLVEDDDCVRASMADSLQAMGYAVTQACNGDAALEALSHHHPDLVITDYLMPGMTGAELMQKVRTRFPALPMIIATGYADMKAVELVIGQNEVLLKPFPLSELAASVERALNKPRILIEG